VSTTPNKFAFSTILVTTPSNKIHSISSAKESHIKAVYNIYQQSQATRQHKITPILPMKKRLSKLIISSSCSFTSVASGLNIALITGSTRTAGPPTVLGPRVNTFIQTTLENRGHTITHIDPKQFALLQKPAFGYASGRAPQELQECQSILQQADAYVCVTPEYNHSPSPALMNVLNHFGSSVFSFKPSAIGKCRTS